MINFNKLDREELSTNGFVFETREEANLFAEVIGEELEIRIGDAITREVGEEKAKEFDLCSPEKAREWLDLSIRSYNCLKRAGLCTVGDVIAYGDLSKIRNLGRKCAEEVKARIWEAVNLPTPLSFEKVSENTDEKDEEFVDFEHFDPDELLDDFLEEGE